MSVIGFLKNGKIEKYDYNALENKPSGDGGGTGLTEEAKQALLTCFQKVAYIDANCETYYQALYDALYAAPKVLSSISASYTQSGEVLTTDSLDSLRKDIVVMAYYNDSTSATVTDYTLSGNLTAGTSNITVYYNGQTDTISVTVTAVVGTYTVSNRLTGCTTSNSATTIAEGGSYAATITANNGYTLIGATASVTMGGNTVTGVYSNGTISIANVTGDIVITVTAAARTLSSISAVFTQGDNVIYTTDTLNSLKQYLVVAANYSDGGSETVSDYTLSGTLAEGTSTITVAYSGQTTIFTVQVTEFSTAPIIMQEDVSWNDSMVAVSKPGACVTKFYDFDLPLDAFKATQYYDAENNYSTHINTYWQFVSDVPNSSTYLGNTGDTVFRNANNENVGYCSMNRTKNEAHGNNRYNSRYIVDHLRVSWTLADIDDSYAYWIPAWSTKLLPVGVNNGDIIFAGRNTPYYNLKNISEAPTLNSIAAEFTQGDLVVTESSTLDSLKSNLAVTANYSDGRALSVNKKRYTLSGTLTVGVSTITVTSDGKTDTFDVVVSEA